MWVFSSLIAVHYHRLTLGSGCAEALLCRKKDHEYQAIDLVLGSGITSPSVRQASKYISITSSPLWIASWRVLPWVQGMTTRSENSGSVTRKSWSSSDHWTIMLYLFIFLQRDWIEYLGLADWFFSGFSCPKIANKDNLSMLYYPKPTYASIKSCSCVLPAWYSAIASCKCWALAGDFKR